MSKKNYYIHEVSELTGKHPTTIRRYIERGFIPAPKREWNGFRIFTQEHIDRIRRLTGQYED